MRTGCRALLAFSSVLLLTPLTAAAADTEILFDRQDLSKTIFPSNLFTVIDETQQTSRRVDLPKNDCVTVTCTDIDVLNEFDGFNPQARISIPFSGPIDVASVSSDTVFLLNLDNNSGPGSSGEKVGINQIVWDPATNTLHVEPDQLLNQHTRYAVVVTNGVLDETGAPVEGDEFERFRQELNFGQAGDEALKAYRDELIEASQKSNRATDNDVVALSVFTTLSTTALLEKVRRQIDATTPSPVSFDVGDGGTTRAVFPVDTVSSIVAVRQTGTAPTFSSPAALALTALQLVPGSVGHVAFGRFTSPNYLAQDESIPTVPTRTGEPAVLGTNDIYFNLFVPAGAKPAGGYPIAIFGHGFGSNKDAAPFVLAAKMAEQGVATIAINVVGHGQGPQGTLTVNTTGGTPVTIPIGGRGIDQNGNGTIDTTEGSSAEAPRSLIGSTDALRQTTIDLMQLVREIQVGIDLDEDGSRDFDPDRIYYFGQSFGGIYGTMFLAIEPDVPAGVPNVAGGQTIDIIRLSPVFRGLFTQALQLRGLLNAGSSANENFPLRDQPPVTNDVPGAMEIQRFMDNSEWASSIGNPVTYAPHLRKDPLPGVPAKSIIFQFAHGDQTVPNPTSTAIVRAGELTDRTSFYRNDIAFAIDPTTPKNPHTFLTSITGPGLAPLVAIQAQTQIATFFASDGATVIDPDGGGPLYEVPIAGPLPETTNYIP